MRSFVVPVLSAVVLCSGVTARAAEPATPTLEARLVDAEKKAPKREATVTVAVAGVDIIDPATVNETARPGQGHLHYRLDGGAVIATTATKLSFHNLETGRHAIEVVLAGNDHKPLGPQQTLTVVVP